MYPSSPPPSRYLAALRRSRATRLALTGAVMVLPLACSDQDADVFGAGDVAVDAAGTSDAAASDTTAAGADLVTTAAPTTTSASSDAGSVTTAADGSPTAPVGTEMVVEFTYAASSAQRAHNPYIAVWMEDLDGNLVQTISLWFEQSSKGTKWLRDLTSWYASSGGDAITSGATRAAGTYAVAWDGTGLDGAPVPAGEYVLYIEAAREHGPHSITSATFTVDGSSLTILLPDDGELSAASATLVA